MLTVTILVKNGERKLKEVLCKLKNFDEVLLLDTGSTDTTLDIAKQFSNVVIHHTEFRGFGQARNLAARLAKHDWILALDADEVLSDNLCEELCSMTLDPQSIYNFPFINIFNGKKIRGCGWYPEHHVRLYNKTKTQFSESLVHEKVISHDLQTITLKYPIFHYSYDSISDFLIKMERYSSLFAEQYQGKKQSSPTTAFMHGLGAFVKGYILKKGFLDGYEGFLICSYNAQTAYYKYLKLYHINR